MAINKTPRKKKEKKKRFYFEVDEDSLFFKAMVHLYKTDEPGVYVGKINTNEHRLILLEDMEEDEE